MDFIIFGFMDNFILILSAGLGNTFSDGVGFLVTGNFTWMALTIVGCLIGMVIIPIMQKIKAR